jgi:signal transduction histidine kinase
MEERVALVGGRFEIWSRPREGTEIFAYIPLTGNRVVGTRIAA